MRRQEVDEVVPVVDHAAMRLARPAFLAVAATLLACQGETESEDRSACQYIQNLCEGAESGLPLECYEWAGETTTPNDACEARQAQCESDCLFLPPPG